MVARNNYNVFPVSSMTLHSSFHKTFIIKDDEDVQQVIDLKHEENEGEGKLKIIRDGEEVSQISCTMDELATKSLKFFSFHNIDRINLYEIYVGIDNPGVHIKINGQDFCAIEGELKEIPHI